MALSVIGYISFNCPYCNHQNTALPEKLDNYRPNVILCELESGGCDKWFTVECSVRVSTSVSGLTVYQNEE